MRTSAIVVTYKTGPVLFDCLGALLDGEGVDEIVVVDNGNPPDGQQRIDVLAGAHEKLQVLRGHGNVGFARACNLGAASARGDFVLFVNPDVVMERGAAPLMASAVQDLCTPAVVGGDLRNADGVPDRGSRRDRVTPWRALVAYSGLSRLAPWLGDLHRHGEPLPDAPTKVGAVSGALLMMRRADFHALGGFDEAYFLHFEDVDLCRRVEEAQGAVVFQPGAIGKHLRSTSDASGVWVTGHKLRGLARYVGKFAQTPAERFVAHAMHAVLTPITMTQNYAGLPPPRLGEAGKAQGLIQ